MAGSASSTESTGGAATPSPRSADERVDHDLATALSQLAAALDGMRNETLRDDKALASTVADAVARAVAQEAQRPLSPQIRDIILAYRVDRAALAGPADAETVPPVEGRITAVFPRRPVRGQPAAVVLSGAGTAETVLFSGTGDPVRAEILQGVQEVPVKGRGEDHVVVVVRVPDGAVSGPVTVQAVDGSTITSGFAVPVAAPDRPLVRG